MKPRRWDRKTLPSVVAQSHSIREVILKLGIIPAGGNYQQVQKEIAAQGISTQHFTGQGWRKNKTFTYKPRQPLAALLQKDTSVQSFKLKKRLFHEGIKQPKCERCGWAERSEDGRIPVKLDHKNGNRTDNRLSNLQILCPNCHSLRPTHRGKNQKRAR